jgi:NADPH:quinone reductase-like Zn-dependent oxidoreductase
MKAIVQEGYGSPDVLKLREIEMPASGDDGVLVEVHAASVNALDWHLARGVPIFLRALEAIGAPKYRIRGVDLAGRVTAVGKNVTRFKPGDAVLGGADGSFAEFAVTTETRLAPKPAGITFEQAATLNIAGLTALQGLRDRARVRASQRVLVNGAGGGVGTFAVQIAKWLGAHVTAVTRAGSIDVVRSLGADEIIDHDAEDFTSSRDRWDVIFDIGGNRPFSRTPRNPRRHRRAGGTILCASRATPQGCDAVAAHSAPTRHPVRREKRSGRTRTAGRAGRARNHHSGDRPAFRIERDCRSGPAPWYRTLAW